MFDQWEAFTERAAILEYDGGFDRRAATLWAFELCFPGDFRECMRIAGGTPEGETALYEYLEGLIKTGPNTLIEGATMNAETKQAENNKHGIAPDGPPGGRETRRRGFERMAEYSRGRPA
jgi:hypothetical protein